MEKKKIKIGLVPKLIIAIIIGILFGQFLPEGFCRFVVTLSGFFSTFLKFVIPLMILAYVTMGIADLSQGAGKLLLITVALAYGSTLIAGSASYLVSSSLFPHFMSEGALDQIAATADASLTPFFSITLEPVMDTLSAVALAFVMGLCLSSMRGKEMGNSLYNGMSDFSKIIDKVLHTIIIPLLHPASKHDSHGFLETYFRFKAFLPDLHVSKWILDSAHDAMPYYLYCRKNGIQPFIDLNEKRGI